MEKEANAEEQDSLELQKQNEHEIMIYMPPVTDQSYPWLLICDSVNDKRQIFYSITNDSYHIRFIPELHNKKITCCYEGCVIVEDYATDECFLLNLSTLKKVNLPPLKIPYHHLCVLSSAKMDSSCRVVIIQGTLFKFRSCHLGDGEYVERAIADAVVQDPTFFFILAATNFEGKLYAMAICDFDLLVADFSDPHLHFTTMIRGKPFLPYLRFDDDTKLYLVESCGEILFIYMNYRDYEVVDVKIFRADFSTKKWENLESLGDRAIFLDAYKGLSSPASIHGLKGNCIYFVNDFDRHLYAYDLEEKSISMSLPCPIVNSMNSSLFWVSFRAERGAQ